MSGKDIMTRDIQTHVNELYEIDISPTLVSNVTDKIMGVATEWQNMPLESVYAAVFCDAIHSKVRENGKILAKASYTAIGVTLDGKRHILGIKAFRILLDRYFQNRNTTLHSAHDSQFNEAFGKLTS